jgi:hypothetical protein
LQGVYYFERKKGSLLEIKQTFNYKLNSKKNCFRHLPTDATTKWVTFSNLLKIFRIFLSSIFVKAKTSKGIASSKTAFDSVTYIDN